MAPECSAHVRPFEVQMVAAASVEHTTRTREQLAPDAEWYGSPLFERFRAPADLDDLLFSYYPIGRNLLSGIGLHRRLGAPRFGARERCLAHLVMSQVDWLHRAETDVPAADHVDALSARQRQVLLRLLTGQGKKQIARGLEISEHTVNDHVKALHAHFNVTSRGELLSKFIAGGGGTGAPTPTIVGVDARGVGRVSSSPKTRV
jgi:DNA-binding CsgD family transcriptional regulator